MTASISSFLPLSFSLALFFFTVTVPHNARSCTPLLQLQHTNDRSLIF